MPDQSRVQSSDLQVVRTEAVGVLLAGLPPVYAQGLSAVLRAGGVVTTVVADVARVALELAGPEPRVAVVLREHAAGLLPAVPATSPYAVVVLVDAATPDVCAELLRSGATGVLTLDDAPDDVLVVLRSAARGRTALPRALVQALCRPAQAPGPSLTPTERVWMQRLAAGGTVAGLARSCGYSEREMYRRLSAVYLRLGARSRTEALLLAERFGMLDGRGRPDS